MTPTDMTLERLRDLLDAHGARPGSWPEVERESARELVARSPEARALRDAAAALDALLDRAPAPEPSPALFGRVLATAPRPTVIPFPERRRRSGAPLVAAVGLAAAASIAVWLVRRTDTGRTLEPAALAELGDYETPTDALLAATDPDTDEAVPAFGCDDPDVACDEPDTSESSPAATRQPPQKEMPA